MAQYIQHPALMGAQQADMLNRDRMNTVGQSIMQANAAIDRAAAFDAARKAKALEQYQMISAGMNPVTGGQLDQGFNRVALATAYGNILGDVRASIAAQGGFNPDQTPGASGFQVAPSRASAAKTNIPAANIGLYNQTIANSDLPLYGRPFKVGAGNRRPESFESPSIGFDWNSLLRFLPGQGQ